MSAKARIMVLQTPGSPELEILERLPEGATIVGVGRNLEDLQKGTGTAHACPCCTLVMPLHTCKPRDGWWQ